MESIYPKIMGFMIYEAIWNLKKGEKVLRFYSLKKDESVKTKPEKFLFDEVLI